MKKTDGYRVRSRIHSSTSLFPVFNSDLVQDCQLLGWNSFFSFCKTNSFSFPFARVPVSAVALLHGTKDNGESCVYLCAIWERKLFAFRTYYIIAIVGPSLSTYVHLYHSFCVFPALSFPSHTDFPD